MPPSCRARPRGEGYDVVVAFGGDGTVNEAANGLARLRHAAVLPARRPRERVLPHARDPQRCGRCHRAPAADGGRLAPPTRRHRRGQRPLFVFSAGVGLDASVVEQVDAHPHLKARFGEWYYTWTGVRTFTRRYLLHPPRLEAQIGETTIAGVTVIVQNATPYTYFGDRPVEMGEGATLDSGDLAGVVLDRARPIDVPTIIARALSRNLRVSRHRHVHSFSGGTRTCRALAGRASAAASGRRRLHRGGRTKRCSACTRTGSRSSLELDRLPMRRSLIALAFLSALAAAALIVVPALVTARPLPGAPSCPVFPADNPWNQRVDRLPVAKGLGRDHRQHRSDRSGSPGLRIGPLRRRADRHPVRGRRRSSTRRVPVSFQYASESDHGPYPLPRGRPDRGRLRLERRSARDRRRPRLVHGLRAVRRLSARRRQALDGRLGRDLQPALRPPAAGRLDLGRRRRAADPARARPLRRGRRRRRSTTRCASPRLHRAPVRLPGAPRGLDVHGRTCRRWACASA